MINYLNKNREQQWEQEWYQIMQSYSCITWKPNFLTSYPKEPKIWLRFIEDIFMIWKDGEQLLRMFLEALNIYHPTIKFTLTMNKNEIVFLDTIVYRSPTSRIYTKIYHKPTDQKQYLHYHSAHCPDQSEGICPLWPFSSDVEEYAQKTTILKKKLKIYNQLKYRKYSTNLLNQAIHQVRNMDRLTLLRPSSRKITT